jgi:two-component system response regulator TctD
MRILLVEDSDKLCGLLTAGLSKAGFVVDVAKNIADGKAAISMTTYAAIVLDLGLPDGDGLALLDFARGRGLSIPMLALTARGSVEDRVEGLRRGADDYLAKPFAFEELTARLRALLRRPGTFIGERMQLGNLSFDAGSYEIQVGETSSALARREGSILDLLLRRSGRVVPKKVIEDQFYGLSEDGSPNAIEVCVHRLRKQLADIKADIEIHTVRGVGYLIKEASA